MRLWTVQPIDVWTQLQSEGFIYVDPLRINPEGEIYPQIEWLACRLRERIADSSGHLPWFAYCERPDLRWIRHSRPKGSQEVLIEFEPPDDALIAFPCWAWDDVFCGQYLTFTRTDSITWKRRLKDATGISFEGRDGELPEPWSSELEASWHRLFLPDLPPQSWRRKRETVVDFKKKREAVVEVLRAQWVRQVQTFIGTWKFRKP
ncbi:MAG: DUF3841 domain-containing protein [Planctomycetaceae bacterium]